MLQANWKPYLWSGIYLLMLLTFLTPLSILTVSLIIIPGLVLFMLLDVKRFAIFYGGILLVLALLTGASGYFWQLFMFSVAFMPPAIVMGVLYKRRTSALGVVFGAIVTLVLELFAFLLFSMAIGDQVIAGIRQYMRNSFMAMPEIWRRDLSDQVIEQAITLVIQSIPLYLVIFSTYYAIITHAVGRQVLKSMGILVNKLKPIRTWMVPRSLAWYFMGALLIDMFMQPSLNSLVATLLRNLLPLLVFVFAVQAISFLFFVSHEKKWNRTIPILGIVLAVFNPALISLLGVIDVAFNLRQRILNNQN